MDKENVLGEKIKLCIAIFLMSLLCLNGCSSNSVEYSSETIDTVGVVIFTDKLIEDKEYDILQRSVSQRTDTNDKFIVEYWWRKNNDSGHYGYYIEQIDGDNYIVIEEGETRYSLKLLPLGGSCAMVGEDTAEEESPGSFNAASVWGRISVVAAGPIFNFILAFVLAVIIVGFG